MLETAIPNQRERLEGVIGDDSTYGNDSDDALVLAARRDPACFATLYRRYASRVYRYLYGKVGNQAEAEDLTSQVFLEALKALPRYRPQGAFAAWLFTLARRRAIDLHRQDKGELPVDWLEETAGVEPEPLLQAIHSEDLRRLTLLYNRLGEEKQELIRLRYAAGLSYNEIGRILGTNQAAAGMAIHRTLQWFKDHWEDENERS